MYDRVVGGRLPVVERPARAEPEVRRCESRRRRSELEAATRRPIGTKNTYSGGIGRPWNGDSYSGASPQRRGASAA